MSSESEQEYALNSIAAFSMVFDDARGRLFRENADALEAALDNKPRGKTKAPAQRRPRKSVLDFQRDLLGKNVIIGRRWGVLGTIVMIVSSTGTGKSVVQTQMAISFSLGIPCCGLEPTRPFRSWVIQSEDDDDRVAIDRDDIIEEMSALHPNADFRSSAVRLGVTFLDFTSFTGAKFLDELERELVLTPPEEKPDCIFINPMNAYFGGTLKEGSDCSAFFKGGNLGGKDTDGLEAIAKRHNVLVVIFGHTPKPPTPKELADWTNDPNIAYKMCGASEIADAVRSILVFLPVPDSDGLFVFNAGKNGMTLGWTDPHGMKTTKSYWRWAASGRHFWEEVPKDEWPDAASAKKIAARADLDADVAELLSHMAHPGICEKDAAAGAKEWGMTQKRARAAFYEIIRNRMKYNVVSNVMQPNDGKGRPKTLFYAAEPTPSQSDPADDPGAALEADIDPFVGGEQPSFI